MTTAPTLRTPGSAPPGAGAMNDAWLAPDGAHPGFSARYVDLWLTSTELAEEQLRAHWEILSPEERVQAERFKPADKRREYAAARGMLRQALAAMTGAPAAGFRFRQDERGKPVLCRGGDGLDIAFNVSHSHGMALAAVALGGKLGVDLEKIRADVNWQGLARRFFSAAERRALDDLPVEKRLESFFECWTRREALVKGTGAGIARGFQAFDGAGGTEAPATAPAAPTAAWEIKNIPAPQGYAAALAVDRRGLCLRLWRAPSVPA